MLVLEVMGGAVMLLALAGVAYATIGGAVVGRFDAAFEPAVSHDAPATILKPLCGEDAGLLDDLESFCRQDYGAPVQLVFGVQDPADPAQKAVESLRAAHPEADLELVVDARQHGANRKVSNLINMVASARHDLVVLSDADISVGPRYLAGVAAALAEPGAGAVTCCYFGRARNGLWSTLGAMGVSYGFLPNVVIGTALGLAKPCMGSTIALTRRTLDEIGGFESIVDTLVDDYEIGRRVRAHGLKVVLPPLLVGHSSTERSLGELFAHELRWAVTVRLIDPAGHLCSVVTHATPLALIGALLLAAHPWAWSAPVLAVATRLWLKARVDRAAGTNSGPWVLMPLRDVLSFAVFLGSLFAQAVYWRGARFGVSSAQVR